MLRPYFYAAFLLLFLLQIMLFAQSHPANILAVVNSTLNLDIPERKQNAMSGSAFANHISNMGIEAREQAVVNAIMEGNVPGFSRTLQGLDYSLTIAGKQNNVRFFVLNDYMAIGSETDYFYIPLTPSSAQFVATKLNCTLPTSKMVDLTYKGAQIKLNPQPIPPSNKMTTVPVFLNHTDLVKSQFTQLGMERTASKRIAGHKKDIIISNKIYSSDRNFERVVIYGWHRSDNDPIQPVYNGHGAMYADYSHGVRLVADTAYVNGSPMLVRDILNDPILSLLLSNEGVIAKPWYPKSNYLTAIKSRVDTRPIEFRLNQNYPNPFNPSTVISYYLAEQDYIDLSVYNLLGKRVDTLVTGRQAAGKYFVEWVADGLTSGTYIYRLKTRNYAQSRKMVLLR